jgi:hypothetical protein
MSSTSLASVFRELFSAPCKAATDCEQDYRNIWADWLKFKKNLLTDAAGNLLPGVSLDKLIETAPIVALDGVIEVGITMRIASVSERNASLSGGLALGPVYASGGYGFMNRTSEESMFQASTRYTITNNNKDLKTYLANSSIDLAKPDSLTKAIEFLQK